MAGHDFFASRMLVRTATFVYDLAPADVATGRDRPHNRDAWRAPSDTRDFVH